MKPSLLIAGLGNPGASYAQTRHNVGFRAVDVLSAAFGEGKWKESAKFSARIQEARVVTVPILLLQPLTYMNLSGDSIRKCIDFYKLNPSEQLLVLCDDVDIPLGELRLRTKGGPGTHNGLKSVHEQFGDNFPRIRIGIGPKPEGADLATWVLSALTAEEEQVLALSFSKLPDLVKEYVLGGHAE